MTAEPTVLNALIRIPVGQVVPGPNARGAVGDVTDLALSIKSLGMQKPILVHDLGDGHYQILDGHRRLAAARQLGLHHVDAVLRRQAPDAVRLQQQLAMHAQAKGFDPIAEAKALHVLMWEHNLSREQIAAAVGKSPVWVRERIALLQLEPDEQRSVVAGTLSIGAALAAVSSRRAQRDGRNAGSATSPGHPQALPGLPLQGSDRPCLTAANSPNSCPQSAPAPGTATSPCQPITAPTTTPSPVPAARGSPPATPAGARAATPTSVRATGSAPTATAATSQRAAERTTPMAVSHVLRPVEPADLLAERNPPRPHLVRQAHSGCAALVGWELHYQSRLLWLGAQIGQHPLAQQHRTASGYPRSPLGLELGPSPACRATPQGRVVVHDDSAGPEQPGNPLNRRLVGHGPTDGRVVGTQAVGAGDVDAAVPISKPGKVGRCRFVQLRDRIRQSCGVAFRAEPKVAVSVVRPLCLPLLVTQRRTRVRGQWHHMLILALHIPRRTLTTAIAELGSIWAQGTCIGGQAVARMDPKGGDWLFWPAHLRVREYPATLPLVV